MFGTRSAKAYQCLASGLLLMMRLFGVWWHANGNGMLEAKPTALNPARMKLFLHHFLASSYQSRSAFASFRIMTDGSRACYPRIQILRLLNFASLCMACLVVHPPPVAGGPLCIQQHLTRCPAKLDAVFQSRRRPQIPARHAYRRSSGALGSIHVTTVLNMEAAASFSRHKARTMQAGRKTALIRTTVMQRHRQVWSIS